MKTFKNYLYAAGRNKYNYSSAQIQSFTASLSATVSPTLCLLRLKLCLVQPKFYRPICSQSDQAIRVYDVTEIYTYAS